MIVSIVITSYNYGKYLHRCIRSCLNQTLPTDQFEVIMVDDFSQDNTKNIIEEYKSLPNFKYIRNNKNRGVAYSANTAIKKAKGKYVVRVDSDDYINNEFAKILSMYLIENPTKFGVACDYYLVSEDENKIKKVSSKTNPVSCGIMYNRKKLLKEGLYNVKFKHREEEELRIRLDQKYKIHHLELPLYRYRMHKTNKTKSKNYLDVYKKKIKKVKKNNLLNKYGNNKILKRIAIIIPARGNSKRLKNKNIFKVNSKPMIYWSIKAAQECSFKNYVYVSSENEKILKIVKNYKAKIIKRPKYLSKDNVFKMSVIKHAVENIEKQIGKKLTLIISLQANSPDIKSEDLDRSIEQLIKYNRQEVISIDENKNSNAAIRTMRRKAIFQKSLSTYLGCITTNSSDIHTYKDIENFKRRNEKKY